jgi:hypothetical protein
VGLGFKHRWDIFKGDLKIVKDHLKTGPSMLRSVKDELNEGVKHAYEEEILKKPRSQSKINLRRGDILGISRGTFEHFGIYFGYDQVIHFTSTNSDISMKNNRIMKTHINHFLRGNPYIFKVDEEKWANTWGTIFNEEIIIYSPKQTIERAKGELGKEGYKLLVNNCEHFAFWCKFGVKKCTQGLDQVGRIYLDYYDQK